MKNVLEELKKDLDDVDFALVTMSEYDAGFSKCVENFIGEMGDKNLQANLTDFNNMEGALVENGKLIVALDESIEGVEKDLGFEFKHIEHTPYNTRDFDSDHDFMLFYNSDCIASEFLSDTNMTPKDIRSRLLENATKKAQSLENDKKVKKYLSLSEKHEGIKNSTRLFDRIRAKGLESRLTKSKESVGEYIKLSIALKASGNLKSAYTKYETEMEEARKERMRLITEKSEAVKNIKATAGNYLRFKLAAIYDKYYDDLQYQETSAKEIIYGMISGKSTYGPYGVKVLFDKRFEKAHENYQLAKLAAEKDGKDMSKMSENEQYSYYKFAQEVQDIMKKGLGKDSKGKTGRLVLEAREKCFGEEKKTFTEMERADQDKIIDLYVSLYKKSKELTTNTETNRETD